MAQNALISVLLFNNIDAFHPVRIYLEGGPLHCDVRVQMTTFGGQAQDRLMQDYIGAEKEWVYKDGRTWVPIPYSPCLFWVFPSRGYPPKAKDFALCSMQKIKAPQ